MKVHLLLDVEPLAETLGLLTSFLRRLKAGPAPTVRDLAALLLVIRPKIASLRLAGTPGAGRHRWVRTFVEVPWSSVPGSLYTCSACTTTKQHLPPAVAGGTWRTEYTVPTAGGSREIVTMRPVCPGAPSSQVSVQTSAPGESKCR